MQADCLAVILKLMVCVCVCVFCIIGEEFQLPYMTMITTTYAVQNYDVVFKQSNKTKLHTLL